MNCARNSIVALRMPTNSTVSLRFEILMNISREIEYTLKNYTTELVKEEHIPSHLANY